MQTLSIYSQNSKKKPLVSFIVTYFNQPLTMLQQCINSILQLSLSEEEREVIVIDDGSERSPSTNCSIQTSILYMFGHLTRESALHVTSELPSAKANTFNSSMLMTIFSPSLWTLSEFDTQQGNWRCTLWFRNKSKRKVIDGWRGASGWCNVHEA